VRILSAPQSLTLGQKFATLPVETQRERRNTASYAFSTVRSEEAMATRLAGVPRSAADRLPLAIVGDQGRTRPVDARAPLAALPDAAWQSVLRTRGNGLLEGLAVP
jgi:hypothetical protein